MIKMEHSQVPEVAEKSRDLKKWLRDIEIFSTLSLDDMCLVPNLVIPSKFKVPNFEKYKGDNCPRHHLVMVCQKMTSYTHDDKMMIHCFQDSSSGGIIELVHKTWNEPYSVMGRLGQCFFEVVPLQLGHGSRSKVAANLISKEQQILQRICTSMERIGSPSATTTLR